jgi:hypothetical protein
MRFKLDENLSPSLATLFSAITADVHLPQEPLIGLLWIVEEHRVRIHE